MLHFWFPSPGFKGNHTCVHCKLLLQFLFLGKTSLALEDEGPTIMLKLFCIGMCKYTTNRNINCIPEGQILLLQTLDPSEKKGWSAGLDG